MLWHPTAGAETVLCGYSERARAALLIEKCPMRRCRRSWHLDRCSGSPSRYHASERRPSCTEKGKVRGQCSCFARANGHGDAHRSRGYAALAEDACATNAELCLALWIVPRGPKTSSVEGNSRRPGSAAERGSAAACTKIRPDRGTLRHGEPYRINGMRVPFRDCLTHDENFFFLARGADPKSGPPPCAKGGVRLSLRIGRTTRTPRWTCPFVTNGQISNSFVTGHAKAAMCPADLQGQPACRTDRDSRSSHR